MSNIPTIESRNLSISRLLQDFYTVPDFQREYVWVKDNVIKLLEDLFEGLGLNEGENQNAEYFLGSIVVCPDSTDDKKTFQLIDGQQRLTTIYLIFCAIRDSIERLGEKSKAVEELITGVAQDINTGEDIDKNRLSLQYDSFGKKVMTCILERKKPDNLLLKSSKSAKNIYEAWQAINDFLLDKLEDNPKRFKAISTAIANRVKLIRIESPNLRNALKVFETINDRGVGLTPVDLLKNYLFINTAKNTERDKRWTSLTNKWEELLKKLYQSNQQPLQFLRYYLISHYQVDLSNNFPEEEIYDWFLKEEEIHEIHKNPVKFIDDLILAAEHYCQFSQAKNTDGSDNVYLKNISKIQGKLRQHLVLLMAGRFLSTELFNKLSCYVENLLFVYTITRKTRRKDINLTREFARWGKELKKVKTGEDLEEFIRMNLASEMEDLKEDFKVSLLQISESNLAKFRLRYMLAKIDQFIEQKTYGNNKPLEWYLDRSITIEHILPQSQKDSYSNKMGNLTLLEKTINSSIADKNYPDKILGYKQSQILITRSLAETPNVGNNTQLNRAMNQFGMVIFQTWDRNCIDERQKFLVNIAMKAWGMDF